MDTWIFDISIFLKGYNMYPNDKDSSIYHLEKQA